MSRSEQRRWWSRARRAAVASTAAVSLTLAGGVLLGAVVRAGAASTSSEYMGRTIMAGDRLRISVAEQPSLNKVYAVAGDGSIDFSYLGRIVLAELTLEQAIEKLEAALEEKYFRQATVTMDIAEFVEGDVLMMGAVRNPGVIPFKGDQLLTLFEAIAMSGGLLDGASADQVHIFRWEPSGRMERATIVVDVRNMFEDLDFSKDQFLRARDIVYIPRAGEGEEDRRILAMGEVSRPGYYSYHSDMDMIGAVTAFGGMTGDALSHATKILRPDGQGGYRAIPVDLAQLFGAVDMTQNVQILPNDIIYVPSRTQTGAGRVFLLGAGGAQGAIPLQLGRDNTLAKILLSAGVTVSDEGESRFADLDRVKVLRRAPDGTKQTLVVNVERILKTGSFEEDVPLRDDDVILIPEKIFGF